MWIDHERERGRWRGGLDAFSRERLRSRGASQNLSVARGRLRRRRRPGDLVVHGSVRGRLRHGSISWSPRRLGARGHVRRWLIARLVSRFVDPGLGVVASHALLHRGVYVTLPEKQRISPGKLDLVGVCLDVLPHIVKGRLLP